MTIDDGSSGAAALKRCPFCEIVADDPHRQIERAFPQSVLLTPLNPVVDGHKLVVSRLHVAHAAERHLVTGLVMADAARYASEIGNCNIITSIGPAATQTIRHLHVHVVPRREGDGLRLPWSKPDLGEAP